MTTPITRTEILTASRLNALFEDKPNPGVDYMFDLATADADPGAGYVRLNNVAWGSATYLYISKTDRNSSPIGPLIGSLMNNGSHLRLFPTVDRTRYLEADIIGSAVDATTYWKIPIGNVIASAAMPVQGTIMCVFPAPSGTPGASYGATSTTSLANAASGSKAFTITSGKAYLTGARIRATSAGTGHWMEGVVASYVGTTLTVTMDLSDGNTGTYDDWSINLTGERGTPGATGAAGSTGATGATGPAGTNGTNGTNGINAGMRWLFASSTTMGNPSAGNVRFDNATLASVTAIAISYSNGESGNPSVANWVKNWGGSTSTDKARLIVSKISAPENYVVFKITAAVTDNTTWGQITVTVDDAAGSFSASDALSVQWARTGDAGSGAVASFNGRSGAVVPVPGDYAASAITNDSTVSGTGVSGALNTLRSAYDALVASANAAYDTFAEVGTAISAILANNWVTTVRIADANVTTAKIADANVTTAKIADSNVTLAKIASIGAATILGNNGGSSAAPSALSVANVRSLSSRLRQVVFDVLGTDQTTTVSGTVYMTGSEIVPVEAANSHLYVDFAGSALMTRATASCAGDVTLQERVDTGAGYGSYSTVRVMSGWAGTDSGSNSYYRRTVATTYRRSLSGVVKVQYRLISNNLNTSTPETLTLASGASLRAMEIAT